MEKVRTQSEIERIAAIQLSIIKSEMETAWNNKQMELYQTLKEKEGYTLDAWKMLKLDIGYIINEAKRMND